MSNHLYTSKKSTMDEDDILSVYNRKDNLRGQLWISHRGQYNFLSDERGELLVDFVGRYEKLQSDFDYICDRLGIGRSALSKLNSTKHAHYSEYYTKGMADLVALLYAEDVEKFEYTFEPAEVESVLVLL